MNVVSFLRKIGLYPKRQPVEVERDEADIENVLRDNNQAFRDTAIVKQHTLYVNGKLAEVIRRANTPFADLENLTKLKRDKLRKGMG